MNDTLLSQWHHLQFAIQRVESASAHNISQRIMGMDCERSVFDEMMKQSYKEHLDSTEQQA